LSKKINIHFLYDGSNNLIEQTYSALNGVYQFLQPAGDYVVEIDTAGLQYIPACPNPGVDSSLTIDLANPIISNVNFALICKPGFDIGVQSIYTSGRVQPGRSHVASIYAGDFDSWYNYSCSSGVSGQIQVTISGPVVFDSMQVGSNAPTINGNQLFFDVVDFGNANLSDYLGLNLTTNTTAQSGDLICIDVVVTYPPH